MSVTVSIDIGSVISDIKVKSFMNTERIADADQRYAVRASEENEAEIRQGVQHAWPGEYSILRPFGSAVHKHRIFYRDCPAVSPTPTAKSVYHLRVG